MVCNSCGSIEIIQIFEPYEVRFECINGHIWYEKYEADGGIYERSSEIEYNFEDTLFPCEKEIYNRVLDVIAKHRKEKFNIDFFDKIKAVLMSCDMKEEEAELFYKKIVHYNPKKI